MSVVTESRPAVFELVGDFQNDQGINPRRGVSIPAKCIVVKNNKEVRIAYQPEMGSIYFDEWKTNKDWDDIRPPKIRFNNNTYPMSDGDSLLAEYLRLCSWNEGNVNKNGRTVVHPKFREIKAEDYITLTPEEHRLRMKAGMRVLDMDVKKLQDTAKILQGEDLGYNDRGQHVSVSFLDANGKLHDEMVLRESMRIFAEDNPQKFFEFMDNENLEVIKNLKEAVEAGIIKVGRAARNISYVNGSTIPKSKCPVGENPIDYFSARVGKDEDITEHYENICFLLDNPKENLAVKSSEDIINEAKALGVIAWEARYYWIDGFKTEFSSNKDILQSVESNSEVVIDENGKTAKIKDYIISRIELAKA